jgi:hypothetical protein
MWVAVKNEDKEAAAAASLSSRVNGKNKLKFSNFVV